MSRAVVCSLCDMQGSDGGGLSRLAQGLSGVGRSLFVQVKVRRAWWGQQRWDQWGASERHSGLWDDIKILSLDSRNREVWRRKWFGEENDHLGFRQFESP